MPPCFPPPWSIESVTPITDAALPTIHSLASMG